MKTAVWFPHMPYQGIRCCKRLLWVLRVKQDSPQPSYRGSQLKLPE